MTRRLALLLFLCGLVVVGITAAFQPAPGYMDADYYDAGGIQLVNGKGFTEPYLWNYLDDPAGLPHPSHAYWMPLASMLAAAGRFLFGKGSWWAARAGFLLAAACLPPLTACLAWKLSNRADLARTAGLLALFPGFTLVYLPTTDTFALYMLLGGFFFLLSLRLSAVWVSCLLGLTAGLMHLARADGLLWLPLACLAAGLQLRGERKPLRLLSMAILLPLAGYLLVMLPWFLRNLAAFGAPLAPGSSRMLWLTSYNQLFSYPAETITFAAWKASGLWAILFARLWALGLNLANLVAVQGGIFLLPLALIGAWSLRRLPAVWVASIVYTLTLLVMTFIFPFAGARGGFLHSGAALLPLIWALVPVGLDRIIAWGVRTRGWTMARAGRVFPLLLVGVTALLTLVVTIGRLGIGTASAWGAEEARYARLGHWIAADQGAPMDTVVIVANPPGFWRATGHPAIALPDGDVQTLHQLALRYGASLLVLEPGSLTAGMRPVYARPQDAPGLTFLADLEGTLVFAVSP